jgi:hypothetical protein
MNNDELQAGDEVTITFPDCGFCQGEGWIPGGGDWVACGACDQTGTPGASVPEILTSDGRLVRNVTMHPPKLPKPNVGLA